VRVIGTIRLEKDEMSIRASLIDISLVWKIAIQPMRIVSAHILRYLLEGQERVVVPPYGILGAMCRPETMKMSPV
jgi:hypothetical protein